MADRVLDIKEFVGKEVLVNSRKALEVSARPKIFGMKVVKVTEKGDYVKLEFSWRPGEYEWWRVGDIDADFVILEVV